MRVFALICASAAALAAPKPQAPDPEFRVIGARETVDRVAGVTDSVRQSLARLRKHFPGTPVRPFTVHLHASLADLPAEIRSHLHPGTPGLALLDRDQIHLILGEVQPQPPGDLQTVVDHEVVHILLHHFAGAAAGHVPRWFHEGLAQHLSGYTYLGSREEDLIYVAHTGQLLRFSDLREDFPDDESARRQAYAQSFSLVSFLTRTIGLDTLLDAARRSTPDDGFAGGFVALTGEPLGMHEDRWRDYIRYDSGAGFRVLLNNCFSYLMILGFVLLALAGIRRWNRDLQHKLKLEREDAMAELSPPAPDDGLDHPGQSGSA